MGQRSISLSVIDRCSSSIGSWGIVLFCVGALVGLVSNTSLAQETRTQTGKLTSKDQRLNSGEYYETFDVELAEGTRIRLDLRSQEFDTFIQVNGLDGAGRVDEDVEWFNDDFESSSQRSVLEIVIPETATYRVMVTSYAADETGSYELTVTTTPPGGGQVDEQEFEGSLRKGDDQLENGEFVDVYPLELAAGVDVVVDLTSNDFDTYLYMRTDLDRDFVVVNDDFEGTKGRSQISFTTTQAGTYRVFVTSYAAGEKGDYRLVVGTRGAGVIAPAQAARQQGSGSLQPGDETLQTGEYADSITFQGQPGQRIRIDLTSDDFDTYLMLRAPSGDQLDNDDFSGQQNRSVIETTLSESGEYRVIVTSYATNETGDYEITIDLGAGGAAGSSDLTSGSRIEGELAAGDSVIEGGRLADLYYFNAAAGDHIRVKLTSEELDTYLILTAPDGTVEVFDDEGNDRNAGINQAVTQDGLYSIAATSYEADRVGAYQLSFDQSGRGERPGARRIFGVFVGIADYPGTDADLSLCDVDAETIYSLLRENYGMQSNDSALLVNSDATVAGLTQALRRIGGQAGPDDLIVFFYSGHGGQYTGEANSADPDGIHETLVLVDGQMTDDEFAELINGSEAGIALVALDACFSGGFAKDVVSARGRMGIFSSEEDVLSQVAAQFQAGGYLSRFLADALLDQRTEADLNSDQMLTAHEMSHYIAERFRNDVRSERVKGGQGGVDPSENLSFQRLVVDRGGVSSSEVLFRW